LAESAANSFGIARHIDADLALGDDAALVAVKILDRVFDGDDMTLAVADLPEPVGPVMSTRPRGR
jgi:hypothetical protein